MAEKEYIEREAALKQNYFSESKTPDDNYRFNAEIKFCISSLPATDVEPVKHGHWVNHKHTEAVICSECGRVFSYETNFCPNCGAKMTNSR